MVQVQKCNGAERSLSTSIRFMCADVQTIYEWKQTKNEVESRRIILTEKAFWFENVHLPK